MIGHTPGPWTLTLRQEWPFGVVVTGPGAYVVMSQNAEATSTTQKTRADNEAGIGFKEVHKNFCTASEARQAIATQDANARLIAAAPELLEALHIAKNAMQIHLYDGNSRYCKSGDYSRDVELICAAIAKATQP